MGCLIDITGNRGVIDLGIPIHETIDKVVLKHHRRNHRSETLNQIEEALAGLVIANSEDVHQWRFSDSSFKSKFITNNIWNIIRQTSPKVSWFKGLWFQKATPKLAFLLWLVIHKRLSTIDRTKKWNSNINSECIFCKAEDENYNHLFFNCKYCSDLWRKLLTAFLATGYTSDWEKIEVQINNSTMPWIKLFLFRYLVQATTYYIWREMNSRRHGNVSATVEVLYRMIDKKIRNFIASLRENGQEKYDNALQLWFESQGN